MQSLTPLAAPAVLDAACRTWLLERGRQAIAMHLQGRALRPPAHVPAGAEAPRGCFVSIHTLPGELRGCVGTFEATRPLWQQVQDMAIAAASRDTRFTSVQEEELDSCILEVSALGARQPTDPSRVRVGEHGLWVQKGVSRGVLLPQVAILYGWDRETFLQQACIKAGLTADAWRSKGVEVGTFTAEVFTEAERLL